MAQLLIMYKQPADPVAFDDYYFGTHVPLFAPTPGVRATSFSKGPITMIAGDAAYYLIATVTFDSMEELQAGLASAPAQAAVADFPNYTGADVDIVSTIRVCTVSITGDTRALGAFTAGGVVVRPGITGAVLRALWHRYPVDRARPD